MNFMRPQTRMKGVFLEDAQLCAGICLLCLGQCAELLPELPGGFVFVFHAFRRATDARSYVNAFNSDPRRLLVQDEIHIHEVSVFGVLEAADDFLGNLGMAEAKDDALDPLEIIGGEMTDGFRCDFDALGLGEGFDLGDDFGGAHG